MVTLARFEITPVHATILAIEIAVRELIRSDHKLVVLLLW